MKRHRKPATPEGRHVNKARVTELPAFDAGRTHRNKADGHEARMNETGITRAQCWCMKGFVDVTVAEVAAGQTRTCGRSRCEAPS